MRAPLPIDERIPEIVASLRADPRLVLRAPPGAGKTTRVPAALLEHGLVEPGREVAVLEPRRIAARLAARRVALERGGALGGEVGYRVRFESAVSRQTRLCFQTEGVFLRTLLEDPSLETTGAVVLDEFHERSADADLALALLREARETLRPDLRVVVMSATLDPAPIAAYLGGCPVLESEGEAWPVRVEYRPGVETERLEARIAAAMRSLLAEGLEGSVLVFVPGAAEIRRAIEALEPLAGAAGFDLFPLHGELSPEEQDRAVLPGPRPRVIVATNVAEASITVEGIEAVVDSGLARVARHDPRTELNRLSTSRISQASARQRAGRAGRTRPGRCLRLYSEGMLAARPAEETPEIRRIELSAAVLRLLAWGARDPSTFSWLTAPEPERVARALRLLEWLGAARALRPGDRLWNLTDAGRSMLRFPVPPRHARVLLEARATGCLAEAAPLVALLEERDLRLSARALGGSRPSGPERRAASDLLERRDDLETARRLRFDPRACAAIGIDARVARRVERAADQLRRIGERSAPPGSRGSAARDPSGERDEAALRALAAGYPDRVVRRRAPGSAEGLMAGGAGTRLDAGSAVRGEELYLALDAAPERDAAGSFVRVRVASAVRVEWLRELFPELWTEEDLAAFDPREERVVARRRLRFLDLPVSERETGQVDPELAAEALAAAVLRDPDRAVEASEELVGLLVRLRWLEGRSGGPLVPPARIRDEEIGAAPKLRAAAGSFTPHLLEVARSLCAGKRSFAELRRADLAGPFLASLPRETRRQLDRLAPEKVALPSGREARLQYEPDQPPALAARLQEFFGSEETPAVGGGAVPVRLHLLAPSHRPVQVTQDLASFWRSAYPRVRSELRRRYPKHAWPEDPLSAEPERSPARRRRGESGGGRPLRERKGRP